MILPKKTSEEKSKPVVVEEKPAPIIVQEEQGVDEVAGDICSCARYVRNASSW